LAAFIKDEDGAVSIIRSGYEVELYRILKDRYLNPEIFRPLPISNLFTEAIYAILNKDQGDDRNRHVTINILDILLTAHNVTRLLARPEQWSQTYPKTYAGQNRNLIDTARPIFQDLMGVRSVDQYPTFLQYNSKRMYFDHQAVYLAFFGPRSVYEFFPVAQKTNDEFPPPHWNAGIHYYFWVGALAQWLGSETTGTYIGGFTATSGAYLYEMMQKYLSSQGLRGSTQLNYGFSPGANTMKRMMVVIDELEKIDHRFVKK